MGRKRVTPGDVLEFVVPDGLGYVQYLGRHPLYGEGILVRPLPLADRPALTDELFAGGYVTFYPAGVAVARGFAEIVGTLTSKGLPTRWRRDGAIDKGGKPLTWIIEDERGDTVREQLTAEERKLPVVEIWNHEMLVHRISAHWRPEDE